MSDKLYKLLAIVAGILLTIFLLFTAFFAIREIQFETKGCLVVLAIIFILILYKYLTRDKKYDGQ